MNFLTNYCHNLIACLREKSKGFVYSLFFPAILSLLTLLFWIADVQVLGTAIVCFCACFVLFLFDDISLALPSLLLLGMTFRDTSALSKSLPTIILLCLLFVAIIFNYIKNRPKKVKFDLLCTALVVVTVTMLIGGAFAPYQNEYVHGLPIITTCFSAFIIHFAIINRANKQNNSNTKNFFCFTFIFAINTACLQMIYAFLHELLIDEITFEIIGTFGWANTNHVSNLILIAVPVCYYLISICKNIIPLLIELCFLYLSCFISQSDGGLVILILFTPILIYKTQTSIRAKNLALFKLFWIEAILICCLTLMFFCNFYTQQLIDYFIKMSNDNLRKYIYIKSWRAFLRYPIFGTSFGHTFILAGNTYSGLLHSTFFQVAASCGVIGLLAYAFLYFARTRKLISNGSSLCSFVLIAFVMFGAYALIDNGEFNIVLIYLTCVISYSLTQTKEAEKNSSLPVCVKLNSLI